MSRENFSKKAVRSNSNSAIVTLLNQNHGIGGLAAANNDSNDFTPTFASEISDIMRGFGDNSRPNRDSVILVEKILLQQMRGILQEAIDAAIERKGKLRPNQQDFEYLMRKHPVKISRLRKHLRDVRLQRKYEELTAGRVSVDSINNDNSSDDSQDDEIELNDEEKVRRLFRADRISQTLTGEDYVEYNFARRVSFNFRNSASMRSKMKVWLQTPADVELTQKAHVILSYLVHETIATIVDLCILTRLNSSNRIVDPYSRVAAPGTSYDMLHTCPEVTQGRGCDGAKLITVCEINEAMRRFNQMSTQKMGNYKNLRPSSGTYLAL